MSDGSKNVTYLLKASRIVVPQNSRDNLHSVESSARISSVLLDGYARVHCEVPRLVISILAHNVLNGYVSASPDSLHYFTGNVITKIPIIFSVSIQSAPDCVR